MENNINKGFSKIYKEYEAYENSFNTTTSKRKTVYNHIEKFISTSDEILEINAGSCIDALYLAKKGCKILATDVSDGFVEYAKSKIINENISQLMTFQQLSFSHIGQLSPQTFDYIFSNLGGLNCIENPEVVINQFKSILKPKGKVTLVIMPKATPWEWLWIFKDRKKALRRFNKQGTEANIEDYNVRTWYHSISSIKKIIQKDYDILDIENLDVFMPPNFDFCHKHPRLFKGLVWFNKFVKRITPLGIGDFYIISFQLK